MATSRKLPLAPNQFAAPLVISFVALAAYFFSSLEPLFFFSKAHFLTGEFWRILTAHFFHTNFYHLAVNIAGLFGLWLLSGNNYSVKNYFGCFVFCGVFCCVGLLIFSSNTNQYVGLSGVLHGIVIFFAIKEIQKKDMIGWILFAGVFAKIIYEQVVGASIELALRIDAEVAIDSHLWGALGGLVLALILILVSNVPTPLFNRLKNN